MFYITDFRNNLISILLHSLLVPTNRIYRIHPQSLKKKLVKSSIADSRNSFLLHASTHAELKSKIKVMVDNCYENKLTIQPIICAIGNDIFSLEEYFVYYFETLYKFDNIIKCIDICFKIFHVLDLKYPGECQLIWTLIQQYLYEIKTKYDLKCSSLSALVTDINNYEAKNY